MNTPSDTIQFIHDESDSISIALKRDEKGQIQIDIHVTSLITTEH
jgi:hypothetical protein